MYLKDKRFNDFNNASMYSYCVFALLSLLVLTNNFRAAWFQGKHDDTHTHTSDRKYVIAS